MCRCRVQYIYLFEQIPKMTDNVAQFKPRKQKLKQNTKRWKEEKQLKEHNHNTQQLNSHTSATDKFSKNLKHMNVIANSN